MADSDHPKHGDMDIHVQEKTFEGFVHIAAWFSGCVVVFLLLLAMYNG
ncbi:aa3-type cytochrome c oxidase subunit IV [Frigidibacter sp. ROC022]|nr:aa3-type cytochrome c oxidase subunit IV [Frigidibacter sp. ROC022]MCR8724925.1 aa3-type cytochrome c oxidase subunit IV [Frigidibacter sp. ROC022]